MSAPGSAGAPEGVRAYYLSKVDEIEGLIRTKMQNLRRLEAQRNELNAKGARACGALDIR
jgi:hypothetical protein